MRINTIHFRIFKSNLLHAIVCILAALTSIPLLAILGKVIYEGWKNISISFFTEATPTAFKTMQAIHSGEAIPGGIANGIIGTLLMLLMASAIAIPAGILCGIFLSENKNTGFAKIVSYMTDLLQGTPSIIIGIIIYIYLLAELKMKNIYA